MATSSHFIVAGKACLASKCEGWKDACDQNDKLSIAIAKLERYEEALKSLHRMAVTSPGPECLLILGITTEYLSEDKQKEALETK